MSNAHVCVSLLRLNAKYFGFLSFYISTFFKYKLRYSSNKTYKQRIYHTKTTLYLHYGCVSTSHEVCCEVISWGCLMEIISNTICTRFPVWTVAKFENDLATAIQWWRVIRSVDELQNVNWYEANRFLSHGPLTRYVKLRVVHAPGMPGRFPRHRLQRKPLVSDPGMHHGTCVTHAPWCMLGTTKTVVIDKFRR